MTESPKIRKVSFGQMLLVGIMCLLMPVFVYFYHAAQVANDESRQLLRQEKSVDEAINKMPVQQRFASPEGTALQTQSTDLRAQSHAIAVHANGAIWRLLLIEGAYLVALFAFLFIAYRNKKMALPA